MTAAAALAADPDHGVARDVLADDHRRRGLPYLTTVPECEPPFDDAPDRSTGARMGVRSAVQPQPWPAARPDPESATVPAAPPPTTRRTARAAANSRGPATAGRADGATPTRAAKRATRNTSAMAAAAVVHSASVPAWSEDADIGVRITTTAELPAAERSASVLARAVIEVLSGRRPVSQLRVHCAPDVYAGLAGRPTFASATLPHLVSVRVCEPADGVAEVSVAYRRAERVRALAFRIQGVDGRWRMTALQLC